MSIKAKRKIESLTERGGERGKKQKIWRRDGKRADGRAGATGNGDDKAEQGGGGGRIEEGWEEEKVTTRVV